MNFTILIFLLAFNLLQIYANETERTNSSNQEYQPKPTTRRPTQSLSLVQRPLNQILGNFGGLFNFGGLGGGSGGTGGLGGSSGGILGLGGGSGGFGGLGGGLNSLGALLGNLGGLAGLGGFGGQSIFGNQGSSSNGGSGGAGGSNQLGLNTLFEGATSRLNEVLGTMTGVLAAIGGGYLLYVGMVAAYGNVLGQQYHLAGHRSDSFFDRISSIDYPELVFDWLHIKEEPCKTKTVCEMQSFLSQNGLPTVVLDSLSRKIPGMKKYMKASRKGLKNQSCFNSCPLSFSQMFLRAFGVF